MKKSISNLPFNGTPAQEAELLKVIEQHKDEKGCLMPIMQKAQDIYGYLPKDVMYYVAEKLGISDNTLRRKLNAGKFDSDEMYQLVELLNIQDPAAIFFAHDGA